MTPTIIKAIINYLEKAKYQEKVIQYLREVDFKFVSFDTLKFWESDGIEIPQIKEKHESYSFMVREVNHKPGDRCMFDSRLVIAIKLNGKKKNKFHIYTNNIYLKTCHTPWLDSDDINFRKMKITLKFPDEMVDYVERRKWRTEHNKLKRFPNKYTPSEFYLKWKPFITELTPDSFYHGAHFNKSKSSH